MNHFSPKNIKVSTTDAAKELMNGEALRLREWLSRGFIEPAYPASGRGSKVYLDAINLYQIGVFKLLLDAGGFSRERASWAVGMLRSASLSKWDTNNPLFLNFYRMTDGYESGQLFSDNVLQYIKLRTKNGDIAEYHIINVGEIILKVNDTFCR